MTRYFMSISEAVQLVLQAAAMAEGADVFTLDMGEPVNILALARRMIRLAGRVPDRDIAIHITGPRPGERLTEEIMSTDETSEASAHPHIVRSTPPRPEPARLRWEMQHLIWMCERAGAADVRRRLRQIAGREPWGDDAESSMLRPSSTLRVVR
jgi:FlaA1/EpsC-like NDP-sugar epimerase